MNFVLLFCRRNRPAFRATQRRGTQIVATCQAKPLPDSQANRESLTPSNQSNHRIDQEQRNQNWSRDTHLDHVAGNPLQPICAPKACISMHKPESKMVVDVQ